MSKAERYVNATLVVFMGGVGGLCVGIVTGLIIGPMILLMLNKMHASDTGMLYVWYMALLTGAVGGAISGAISGSLLGLTFCFIKHRIIGALGGSLIGSIVCLLLWNSPLISGAAAASQAIPLFVVGITGGAMAGYSLACVLLRAIKDS